MFNKKVISFILIVIGVLIVVGFSLFSYLQRRDPAAGLKVETNVPAIVFVDKNQVGRTPLDKIFTQGEVTVKLIPDSTSSALASFQTKVQLTNKTYTLIHRDFAATESDSAGDIISVHTSEDKKTSLTVLSTYPDRASVTVDGQPQGNTPLVLPQIAAGDHTIVVTSPGFKPRTVVAKAIEGFRLQVSVKLASDTASTPTPTATSSASISGTPAPTTKTTPSPTTQNAQPTPPQKPYVKIGSTPTGFLRVRSRPSSAGSELGQVTPGEMFPLLDSESGWYLITVDLDATSSGWISSQYATKYE